MIDYLQHYFRPDRAEPGGSLAIQGGSQGARLTHSHERQYTYVLQSLTLWREISHEVRTCTRLRLCTDMGRGGLASRQQRASVCAKPTRARRAAAHLMPTPPCYTHSTTQMFKLWCLGDSDLLREGNYYRLQNTGQGLNRVQSAPQGKCAAKI